MPPAPNATKGRHYLDLLDNARCEGDWDAVPELVRKVRKHAPNRVCLTLTAEIEHGISKATASETPITAASDTAALENAPPSKDIEAAAHIPKLLASIEEEHTYAEDRFQAQVCVGWLHWAVGEYKLALDRLPEGFGANEVESLDNISEWTRVCMLKSAYLRANCLSRNGNELDALAVFEASLPPSSHTWTSQTSRKQLRYWSELFLTEYCMLHKGCLEKGELSLEDMNSLICFRSWARWWDGSKGAPLAGGYGFKGSVSRRQVWSDYYKLLSTILQQDLPYPTAHAALTQDESSARSQLLVEIKRAETHFEALLLNETSFPNANEEREEIELFVATLMQNWRVLTGRGWSEKDLGQEGKAGLSVSVLEMLYRASMKTYHSTAILRNLFIVHTSVAEFDLAFKAFDAYLDIANKGRARVEKTGHQETGLDDDTTIIETISLCISALCRFGGRDAAEKAKEVASELEHWLERIEPPQANGGKENFQEEKGRSLATAHRVPAKSTALAWQSIGLAHAQWARMTFDASARTEMQKKAIISLHTSLSTGSSGSADVRGVFALALLLAEQRELTSAIELVKAALLARSAGDDTLVLHNGPFWRERSLIPLWHLLSLLLSARQEYVLAARTCECAFEQFGDPAVLYGRQAAYKSDHLNEAEKDQTSNRALVDEMDDFEKENILEVKMTQLAIVEITEGPRIAVNASLELLTLFSRLFGNVQVQPTQSLEPPKTANPPKTSATFRGFRTGIFGSRNNRSADKRDSVAVEQPDDKLEPTQSQPETRQSVSRAPTIQVTKENSSPNDRHTRTKSTTSEKRSESARRGSTHRRDSQAARRRAASTGPVPHPATVVDGEPFYTPMVTEGLNVSDFFSSADKSNPLSRPSSAVNPDGMPLQAGMSGIALDGMEPAGAILPIIQFEKAYERRRRSAILVKVWLMIAGFYRRARMYDDAKGSVNEAQKLVQTMEAELGKDSSELSKRLAASPSLRDPGWAGKKSIEELWGDVWCEVSDRNPTLKHLGAAVLTSTTEWPSTSRQGGNRCCPRGFRNSPDSFP